MAADNRYVDAFVLPTLHGAAPHVAEAKGVQGMHMNSGPTALSALNVIDVAALVVALREVEGLSAPADIETDAQAEAVATLWGIAAAREGAMRQRAAAALWRLGVAPGRAVPCAQPGWIAGQCIAFGHDCGRCELNPAIR